MSDSEEIPIEIRARVEANALFEALRTGDYAEAARSQERLRLLGFHLSREAPPQRRAAKSKEAADAAR